MVSSIGLLRGGIRKEKKAEGLSDNDRPETEQSKTTETASIDHRLLNDQVESALESLAGDIGHDVLERQALSAISGLAKGDFSHAAKTLAIAAGEEPEAAAKFIQGAYEGFRLQAAAYVNCTYHDVNADEVFEWASHALSPSEKASLYHHIYLGQSKVLDDLVNRYQRFGRRAD